MSETAYKFFCYRVGTTWRGQQLLSVAQIRTQLATLRWEYEVFATIQTYDEYANCLSSPLFFDFDGQPDQVHADARDFVFTCEYTLNITPRIYFSGNRGFHFIIDFEINHPQCHQLAADFAREMAPRATCDMRVYRNQSMLRIPGSLSSDHKRYKIQLTRAELMTHSFDTIRKLALTQRMIADENDHSKIDTALMDDWLATAIAKLPTYDNAKKLSAAFEACDMDFTPCLERMLYTEPHPGSRNETAFVLARYFKLAGFDKATTLRTILAQPHWAEWDALQGEATKLIRSLYSSTRNSHIGCRGDSSTAHLMRSHCEPNCFFRTDWPELNLIDDRRPP